MDVNIVVLFDSFGVVPDFPLARHVDVETFDVELERAKGLLQDVFVHFFHEAHTILPVPVGGVPLHGDVFWEVFVGDVFIAEAWAEVVDSFVAGSQKAFEWEFVGDTEIEFLMIEGIHTSHERIGVGAASGVLEDRDVNFDEVVVVEKVASGLPKFRAADETITDL